MHIRYSSQRGGECGFSLIEVMVALIIICVGLLGIAKLEALMLSSTGTSRLRALMALQAASLADAMHADRDYWDGGTSSAWNAASGNLALSGSATGFTGTNAPVAGDPSCAESAPGSGVTPCTSLQLADYDLSQWAQNVAAVAPNFTSSIACSAVTGVVSCSITLQWNENTVAANSQEAAAGAPTAFQQQTYTLVVEP
ncbi:MAG: type IV pilus modification PilV family protein [Steroidobacteraceae bacterium]